MRKRFPKYWRRRRHWHYVIANGSAGYCYDRAALKDIVQHYQDEGYEVAIFRIKKKGWRP